jgi:hypothetical protein
MSMSGSCRCPITFRCSCISLPHACHMPRPSHPRWFDHPRNVWWGLHIRELLVVRFRPYSVTSSSSSLNISQSTLFTNTLCPGYSLSVWEIKLHTRRKQPNSPGSVLPVSHLISCVLPTILRLLSDNLACRDSWCFKFQILRLSAISHIVSKNPSTSIALCNIS